MIHLGGSGIMTYVPPDIDQPGHYPTTTETHRYSPPSVNTVPVAGYFGTRFMLPPPPASVHMPFTITDNINYYLHLDQTPDFQHAKMSQVKAVMRAYGQWIVSLPADLQSLAFYIQDYGLYTLFSGGKPQWGAIDLDNMVYQNSHPVPLIRGWWYIERKSQLVPAEIQGQLGELFNSINSDS